MSMFLQSYQKKNMDQLHLIQPAANFSFFSDPTLCWLLSKCQLLETSFWNSIWPEVGTPDYYAYQLPIRVNPQNAGLLHDEISTKVCICWQSSGTSVDISPTNTVFCQINTPGAEAENEPLILSDFDESRRVDTWMPELYVLKIWFRSVK